MSTRDKPVAPDDFKSPPPGSDGAAYLAYVEKKIRTGQNDVKNGRTCAEADVWEALGVAD